MNLLCRYSDEGAGSKPSRVVQMMASCEPAGLIVKFFFAQEKLLCTEPQYLQPCFIRHNAATSTCCRETCRLCMLLVTHTRTVDVVTFKIGVRVVLQGTCLGFCGVTRALD